MHGLRFTAAREYRLGQMLNYKKYRGILISIALFILLDASVMMLNFYISFEISADALGVNLAGRQRMLSQRMAKSLYVIHTEQVGSDAFKAAVAELKTSRNLFDETLNAFVQGGTTQGADQERVELPAVKTDQAKGILAEAATLWLPYRATIDKFLLATEKNMALDEFANQALAQAKKQNLPLLALMNRLTVNLEHVAASKAKSLRIIQTVGLVLAIINFLFIILHFIRQLRDSDEVIERARRETTEILQTVNEGLFLVDENMRIGEQYSSQLTEILGVRDIAGQSFELLLGNMINERDAETARGFIELLFDKKIKPKLIGDLNPLSLVEVNIAHASGGFLSKFLQFSFARAYQGNNISHVLVTVVDVTEKVRLEKALQESRSHNESQIEMLTSLLHTHPALLQEFIRGSYDCFNRINNILRQPTKNSKSLRDKASEIFREIHNFKGESASLKLEYFERYAHAIEDTIAGLQAMPEVAGNDYLGLTVQLEALISYTQQVEQMAKKLLVFGQQLPSHSAPPQVAAENNIAVGRFQDGGLELSEYVQHIAKRNGKLVNLISSGINEIALAPAYSKKVREICIQLLRNAVIHGIEAPDDRELSEKPLAGRIDLRIAQISASELELVVMDDGAGLNYDAIREKALTSGRWSESEIESWGNKKLMALIFQEGFSTADTVSTDAGRGVGMELVMNHVLEHRGRIAVSSRRGSHCRFVITLPIIRAEQLVA
ncbi:MAG TPA: ATP-binding protein [Cellvibrio sp.]|nr:ATP-binding protein [Cellvibrio sp.]